MSLHALNWITGNANVQTLGDQCLVKLNPRRTCAGAYFQLLRCPVAVSAPIDPGLLRMCTTDLGFEVRSCLEKFLPID